MTRHMRLQSAKAGEYNGKIYEKHSINLPQETIDALGWKKGDELDHETKGKTLIVRPLRKTKD